MPDLSNKAKYTRPALLLLAVLLTLGMLRLGVWQLDRAEQKRVLVERIAERAQQPEVELSELILEQTAPLVTQRYRAVTLTGRYQDEPPLFLDGRVRKTRVGYEVYSLFVTEQGQRVLINRGWVYAGQSRAQLPKVGLSTAKQILRGRLNVLAPPPPMWDDRFPVHTGQVWQYLSLAQLRAQYGQNLQPMVVELHPELVEQELLIEWRSIDDSDVAVHQGYAFQWFSMALAFAIASLVLLIKSLNRN